MVIILRLQEARRDFFRNLAREKGYKSRAAFKLIQANEKYHFINEGDKVIDFGAAPGGWLQVASSIVGGNGVVIGIDVVQINLKNKNVKTIVADVYDSDIGSRIIEIIGGRADVILSDLSPKLSGVWELDHNRQIDLTERVIDISSSILRRGGNSFLKLFDGERLMEIVKRLNQEFDFVKVIKPAASRKESSELYCVCKGYKT